jgi:hypothetical protein
MPQEPRYAPSRSASARLDDASDPRVDDDVGESIEEWEARSKRAAGRQSDNYMVKLTNQISLV